MNTYSEKRRILAKVCSCCHYKRDIKSFAYLSESAQYHSECSYCVARKAIVNRSEVFLFVKEYGLTPKVFQSLRRRAEKMGYLRTQGIILAKLNESQRKKYRFCFTISKLQDAFIALSILGIFALVFDPLVGLSIIGTSSLFLIWSSSYKRKHQDPVIGAIQYNKQVHIETCFLELKQAYQNSRRLAQLPKVKILNQY